MYEGIGIHLVLTRLSSIDFAADRKDATKYLRISKNWKTPFYPAKILHILDNAYKKNHIVPVPELPKR
jgi:hypothetical protein